VEMRHEQLDGVVMFRRELDNEVLQRLRLRGEVAHAGRGHEALVELGREQQVGQQAEVVLEDGRDRADVIEAVAVAHVERVVVAALRRKTRRDGTRRRYGGRVNCRERCRQDVPSPLVHHRNDSRLRHVNVTVSRAEGGRGARRSTTRRARTDSRAHVMRINRSGHAIWTILTTNHHIYVAVYALYVEVRHLVVYSFSCE
jgi:hypothetical protein